MCDKYSKLTTKKNADFARRGKACATGEQGW